MPSNCKDPKCPCKDPKKHQKEEPEETKIPELKLRDTVRLFNGEYGVGTVTKTEFRDGLYFVTVIRPHIVTEDFEYTGGVLWSIGVETVTLVGDEKSTGVDVLGSKGVR